MFIPNRIITWGMANAASAVDTIVFVCESGAEYEVLEVIESHTVAGSDGGTVSADLKRAASGTAPGSGTSMLASVFNMKSTANTPVTKSLTLGTLATAQSSRRLTAGQALTIDFSGTLTALAGVCFTIVLKPLRRSNAR
jgi:hypothetical protein